MKNIYKIVMLLSIVWIMSSCEEKKWPESEAKLVSVYSMTELTDNNKETLEDPFRFDVYKEKPLFIRFDNATMVRSFEMSNYNDLSVGTEYNLSFEIEDLVNVTYTDTIITYDSVLVSVGIYDVDTNMIVNSHDTTLLISVNYALYTAGPDSARVDTAVVTSYYPGNIYAGADTLVQIFDGVLSEAEVYN